MARPYPTSVSMPKDYKVSIPTLRDELRKFNYVGGGDKHQRVYQWSCDVCGQAFDSYEEAQTHEALCRFRQQQKLKLETDKHTNSEPYTKSQQVHKNHRRDRNRQDALVERDHYSKNCPVREILVHENERGIISDGHERIRSDRHERIHNNVESHSADRYDRERYNRARDIERYNDRYDGVRHNRTRDRRHYASDEPKYPPRQKTDSGEEKLQITHSSYNDHRNDDRNSVQGGKYRDYSGVHHLDRQYGQSPYNKVQSPTINELWRNNRTPRGNSFGKGDQYIPKGSYSDSHANNRHGGIAYSSGGSRDRSYSRIDEIRENERYEQLRDIGREYNCTSRGHDTSRYDTRDDYAGYDEKLPPLAFDKVKNPDTIFPSKKKWACDKCKEAHFQSYVDAFVHEKYCQGIPHRAPMENQMGATAGTNNTAVSRSHWRSKSPARQRHLERLGRSSTSLKQYDNRREVKYLCSLCEEAMFDDFESASLHEAMCRGHHGVHGMNTYYE